MKKMIFMACAAGLMLGLNSCKSTKNVSIKDLLDKEWILTEIQGTTVTPGAENTKTAFITFKAEDNRVSGNSGCNTFSGVYELKSGNGISFSKMISTRMMCINNMDIEAKMSEIFQIIDSYSLSENTLTLNRGKEILARFENER